ncbi:MAG: glycosyltransferase family 2 protein [Saprospiraceae bacterium]|nr:glycosyltransferase family 2 protein [Saprospiraceae bacterium]
MLNALAIVFTGLVIFSSLPLFTSLYQFLLVGIHGYKNHYCKTKPITPRVAIIIPAWNEGSVIGTTIEQLYGMDYPKDALRIYVVDDASTDDTPTICKTMHEKYPDNVFHLRRENGGQGKAHTLNHGIEIILSETWAEAFLIMDADVLFENDALRKMSRHLADPEVGSVTAYIKEGSSPGNYISKCIAFEYITAQAASRRAQNIMGKMACLAGGAQLHTRENLLAIGGRIDTSSLAEDTFTTFNTQLNGRKAVFDGNAIVWAEEPDNVVGVWKQRLRWARGNVQLTKAFKHVWFNRKKGLRLGSADFGILWFAIILMPFFMIFGAIGLVALFFIDFPLSWFLFKQFWILNSIVYLFVTLFSFGIDPFTAKRSWVQGLLFPGLISLIIIVLSAIPGLLEHLLALGNPPSGQTLTWYAQLIVLFMYSWLALCMLVTYWAYLLEKNYNYRTLAKWLIIISGFGPLLCAITLQSYISEWKKTELKWDKTEKSGKVKVMSS